MFGSKLDVTGRNLLLTVEGTTLNYNYRMAKQTAMIYISIVEDKNWDF